MTVNWATTTSIKKAHVRYGSVRRHCRGRTAKAQRRTIVVGRRTEFQWRSSLGHLKPNKRYCYKLYGDSIDLLGRRHAPRFRAQVSRKHPRRFSFAVFGDWGLVGRDGRNRNQAALLRQVAMSNARFAVTTGDAAYPGGSQTNYGDLTTRGRNTSAVFAREFWARAGDSIPLFNALGNHGLNQTALVNWPQPHAVSSSRGRYRMERYCCVNGTKPRVYPSSWYAFDAGRARFYVLDAAWGDTNVTRHAGIYENDYDAHWRRRRDEYRWLRRDLRTHRRSVSFAFFHFPLYSDNAQEGSDRWLTGPGSLESLLGRFGVDIVFNGHAHIYERNAARGPRTPISYVTGAGGGRPAPVSNCSGFDRYAIGWSRSSGHGSACGSAPVPASVEQVYHFLLVQVDGRTVTVTPTDSNGNTFDVQTYLLG